ncbi:hypothetical protein PIB30_049169 [Stylosanthes scabra]|uniref:Uncharacterized protein n=1 Tax=Stylosanthes scabra TaxID=79078 RepID=A0ABU6RHE5_9FABA|nr:hypothetical protein [Stylosanthes scabra]
MEGAEFDVYAKEFGWEIHCNEVHPEFVSCDDLIRLECGESNLNKSIDDDGNLKNSPKGKESDMRIKDETTNVGEDPNVEALEFEAPKACNDLGKDGPTESCSCPFPPGFGPYSQGAHVHRTLDALVIPESETEKACETESEFVNNTLEESNITKKEKKPEGKDRSVQKLIADAKASKLLWNSDIKSLSK